MLAKNNSRPTDMPLKYIAQSNIWYIIVCKQIIDKKFNLKNAMEHWK